MRARVLKSIYFLEEAVDLVPDYLEAWIKLSEHYSGLSLLDKAVSCCRKAHEIDSGNVLVCLRMGDLCHRLEWFEKSISYYERVSIKEPGNYLAWFGLASVYKDTQRYMQANICWKKIIEIIDN